MAIGRIIEGFSIGQTVFILEKLPKYVRCDVCDGKAVLTVKGVQGSCFNCLDASHWNQPPGTVGVYGESVYALYEARINGWYISGEVDPDTGEVFEEMNRDMLMIHAHTLLNDVAGAPEGISHGWALNEVHLTREDAQAALTKLPENTP